MKSTAGLLIILFLFFSPLSSAQKYFAGAEGSFLMPVGGLGERFNAAPGFAAYFGSEVSPQWKWTGKLEYFKFDKINKDNYSVKRLTDINNAETEVTLPLQDTTMELSVIGLSANADYNLLRTDFVKISAGFGFGIYRWESSLGSFNDSLYYNDNGNQILVEILKIPPVKQLDWSGGFNAGVNVDVRVYGPVWFNAGAHYKNIIGELWAVLTLDMESISTFQMFQAKAGISIDL